MHTYCHLLGNDLLSLEYPIHTDTHTHYRDRTTTCIN